MANFETKYLKKKIKSGTFEKELCELYKKKVCFDENEIESGILSIITNENERLIDIQRIIKEFLEVHLKTYYDIVHQEMKSDIFKYSDMMTEEISKNRIVTKIPFVAPCGLLEYLFRLYIMGGSMAAMKIECMEYYENKINKEKPTVMATNPIIGNLDLSKPLTTEKVIGASIENNLNKKPCYHCITFSHNDDKSSSVLMTEFLNENEIEMKNIVDIHHYGDDMTELVYFK